MKCCPFCKNDLSIDRTSIVSSEISYSCNGNDHKYHIHYDLESVWEELNLGGISYFGADIYKICKLKIFT